MVWLSIFKFEIQILFIFFFKPLHSPRIGSHLLEYESSMSERHDSFHLEEKTNMPKTSTVWKSFKLSEAERQCAKYAI